MLGFEKALAEIKSQSEELRDRQIVGINGILYDITYYIKHHPGGDVIGKFSNKEASIVYNTFNHKLEYLDKLKKVGTYIQEFNPIDKDFLELDKEFERLGFKEGNRLWFYFKLVIIMASVFMVYFLFSQFDHIAFHILGSFFLFFAWQQSGFIMHDTMHSHMFHNAKYDEIVGMFFSTVIVGINGLWWKQDHNVHHALTGVIDIPEKWMDPQLQEGVWAQNIKMFPFYNQKIHYILIKIQAYLFLPLNIFLGRFGIMIDSFFIGDYERARSILVFIPWIMHWTLIVYLFSFLPSWQRIFLTYFLASSLQGILHLQLLISHYSKIMLYREEFDNESWFKYNIDNNLNINCGKWFDWFHGGLNFHIEHHTFPTIPRHNYRKIAPYVQELCRKHNIQYDSFGWFEAVWNTVKHLSKISKEYIDNCDKFTPAKI